MNEQLSDRDVNKIILEGLNYIKTIFVEPLISELSDPSTEKKATKKIYAKMNKDLPDPIYYIVMQIIGRLMDYAEAETLALEAGKTPIFPRTKTNIDFTIKNFWKKTIRPILNKKQLEAQSRDENIYHDFLNGTNYLLLSISTKFD